MGTNPTDLNGDGKISGSEYRKKYGWWSWFFSRILKYLPWVLIPTLSGMGIIYIITGRLYLGYFASTKQSLGKRITKTVYF